jgi:hypothetical protein
VATEWQSSRGAVHREPARGALSCRATRRWLADKAGVRCIEAFDRAVRDLEQLGLIAVERSRPAPVRRAQGVRFVTPANVWRLVGAAALERKADTETEVSCGSSADYPDPLYIFVNQANFITWNNYNLTGQFCSSAMAAAVDPSTRTGFGWSQHLAPDARSGWRSRRRLGAGGSRCEAFAVGLLLPLGTKSPHI